MTRRDCLPEHDEPISICGKLADWAEVAGIGRLAVTKSDLLSRLIHGGEHGPSRTPCPVHQGKWSGCHFGWPGSVWVSIDAGTGEKTERPMEVEPHLQVWWDAGCRCATHKGSSCTTGWNPDENCCLTVPRS